MVGYLFSLVQIRLLLRLVHIFLFFIPFIMPFRVTSETVSTAGIVVSIMMMIVFTSLYTLLLLIIYRSSVLVYSDARMMKTMKTSWSILKNERKK